MTHLYKSTTCDGLSRALITFNLLIIAYCEMNDIKAFEGQRSNYWIQVMDFKGTEKVFKLGQILHPLFSLTWNFHSLSTPRRNDFETKHCK